MRRNGKIKEKVRSPLMKRYAAVIRKTMKDRTRRYFAMALAGVVVFTTTYALILPAITLEREEAARMPGMTVGTHATATLLDCKQPVHQHTDACYAEVNGEKKLVCGQADYVYHTHDANCYDADGNLICKLPEVKPGDEGVAPQHTHVLSCYEYGPHGENALQMGWVTMNPDGTLTGGEEHLICDQVEVKTHQHTADCFHEEAVEEKSSGEEAVQAKEQNEETGENGASAAASAADAAQNEAQEALENSAATATNESNQAVAENASDVADDASEDGTLTEELTANARAAETSHGIVPDELNPVLAFKDRMETELEAVASDGEQNGDAAQNEGSAQAVDADQAKDVAEDQTSDGAGTDKTINEDNPSATENT